MISVKKMNLTSTDKLFQYVVSRDNFTINKYYTSVHMQLPVIVLIPTISLKFLFGASEGSEKFHGMFLMAVAMKQNTFTMHVLNTCYGILTKGIAIGKLTWETLCEVSE